MVKVHGDDTGGPVPVTFKTLLKSSSVYPNKHELQHLGMNLIEDQEDVSGAIS